MLHAEAVAFNEACSVQRTAEAREAVDQLSRVLTGGPVPAWALEEPEKARKSTGQRQPSRATAATRAARTDPAASETARRYSVGHNPP